MILTLKLIPLTDMQLFLLPCPCPGETHNGARKPGREVDGGAVMEQDFTQVWDIKSVMGGLPWWSSG